jgi:hypothetical protein
VTHLAPEQVIQRYDEEERRREELHDRMDADYKLWRLEPFKESKGTDGSGTEEANDYAKYTSNDPKTFAKKVISILSTAKIISQVPASNAERDERKKQNEKERWVTGVLKSADERLRRMKQGTVQAQISFFMPIRGHYAARALLRKDEDESTVVDITPWDPRFTMYKVGGKGLIWAINKSRKSREDIKDTWGIDLASEDGVEAKPEDMFAVYDYYDRQDNTLVVRDAVLKKPQEHGSPRTPVVVGSVGQQPLMWDDEIDDMIKDWGESIYDQDRNIYPKNNLVMSILLEHVKRSRKQPLIVESPDGTKTLEGDPWVEGTEISVAQGEKITVLDALRAAPEVGAFAGLVSGELQRGSLPYSAFGELQFQLSGFAINSLRQGMSTVLEPLTIALKDFYLDTIELLSDQYATESFAAFEVSGRDRDRNFFSEKITPKVVKEAGNVEIKILAELPQDDTTKMALAQQGRAGPTPLLPDRFIREEILGIQDADLMGDALLEQMAERASPLAATWTLMKASAEMGREDLARIYFGEALNIMRQQQTQGAGPQEPSPNGTVTEASQALMPNNVAPSQAQGVPQVAPTPQAGPLVPPGSPRPGAQGPGPGAEQILNALQNGAGVG